MSEQTSSESNTTVTPVVIMTDDNRLKRAVEKWVNFHKDVFAYIQDLGIKIRRYNTLGSILRLVIIFLSAAITTLSNIGEIPRTVITMLAGILTVITGVEAYFKFTERSFDAKKTQRELEALRDQLRFAWFIDVEVGSGNLEDRIENACKMMIDGPAKYNELLTKYVMESGKVNQPEINTG